MKTDSKNLGPLEVMTEAIKKQSPDIYGGVISDESAEEIARSALLALVDTGLPTHITKAGAGMITRDPMLGDYIAARACFRAMLYAIANEGNPDVEK